MLLRFILQVSNFCLHPDVHSLYTPMYTVCRSGCTNALHPGLQKVLQPANQMNCTVCNKKTIFVHLLSKTKLLCQHSRHLHCLSLVVLCFCFLPVPLHPEEK